MRIKRKIFIIILIVFTIIDCNALTKVQQENISTYAREMVLKGNERRDKNGYPLLAYLSGENRLDGWNGKLRYLSYIYYLKYTLNGKDYYINGNRWVFNCDSFVSYVLYHTYGIQTVRSDGNPWYVSDYDRHAESGDILYFVNSNLLSISEINLNNMEPGDVILCYSSNDNNNVAHVILYLGDGKMAHAATGHLKNDVLIRKEDLGLQVTDFKEHYKSVSSYRFKIARIRETAPTKEVDMRITWPDTGKVEILGYDEKPNVNVMVPLVDKPQFDVTLSFKDDKGIVGYAVSKSSSTPTEWISLNKQTSYEISYNIIENGTYYFFVKDTKNQVSFKKVSITNINSAKPEIQNIEYHYNEDGTFNIKIIKVGEEKILYSIDGINYQESNTFNNLKKQTHSLYLKGTNGIITIHDINLSDDNLPQINITYDQNYSRTLLLKISFDKIDNVKGYYVSTSNQVPNKWIYDNLNNINYSIPANAVYYVWAINNDGIYINKKVEITNIDNIKPVISSIDINKKTSTGASITIDAYDKESGIRGYSLDGITFQDNKIINNLTYESHTIYVSDNAGNIAEQTIMLEANETTKSNTYIYAGLIFCIIIIIIFLLARLFKRKKHSYYD